MEGITEIQTKWLFGDRTNILPWLPALCCGVLWNSVVGDLKDVGLCLWEIPLCPLIWVKPWSLQALLDWTELFPVSIKDMSRKNVIIRHFILIKWENVSKILLNESSLTPKASNLRTTSCCHWQRGLSFCLQWRHWQSFVLWNHLGGPMFCGTFATIVLLVVKDSPWSEYKSCKHGRTDHWGSRGV